MKYFILVIPFLLLSCAQVSFKHTDSGLKGKFRLKDASSVSIYTSADGYAEHMAVKDGEVWHADLPKAKEFKFFIKKDGRLFNADCPQKEQDDFGSELCIYEEE